MYQGVPVCLEMYQSARASVFILRDQILIRSNITQCTHNNGPDFILTKASGELPIEAPAGGVLPGMNAGRQRPYPASRFLIFCTSFPTSIGRKMTLSNPRLSRCFALVVPWPARIQMGRSFAQ